MNPTPPPPPPPPPPRPPADEDNGDSSKSGELGKVRVTNQDKAGQETGVCKAEKHGRMAKQEGSREESQ